MLLAGNRQAQAVVRVVAVDEDSLLDPAQLSVEEPPSARRTVA